LHEYGGNAFTIELKVNDRDMQFEIDTGSSIIIVSEEDFYKNQLSKTMSLEKVNIVIKTYS